MKISAREMLVAATAQLRRDETITSLARRAGLQRHSFLYALTRLQEMKVLRPWVLVNPFQMGFEEAELFLTIGSSAQRQRSAFQSFLQTHPQVIWYGSLGATYQFGVRIIAQGAAGFQRFLDEIERHFPALVMRKSFVHILSFTTLPKRYLALPKKSIFPPGIEIRPQSSLSRLDKLDLRILRVLLENPLASERDISRVTTHARATISIRLDGMKKSGVLLGSVYLLSARALGYHAYRMLIYGKGLRRELTRKISEFAKNDFSVVNITQCLGEWDYELSIEVQDSAESALKVSALYEQCDGLIDRIELLPVFEQGISSDFLSEKATQALF